MNKKTEAKSNGSMLTVSFHSANPPLIWRFDLERNHSFLLALQGDDGEWELGVTSPKGDFYSVAHFAAREDAEEAFAKVEKALLARKASLPVVARALLALVVAIVVVTVLFVGGGIYLNHQASLAAKATPTVSGAAVPSPDRQGVPLSADDILSPPK